jgi:hypothetical protein
MIFAFILLIIIIIYEMLGILNIYEAFLWAFLAAELIALHGDIEELLEELKRQRRWGE